MAEQNTGKITQVIGAVLDIRFDQGVLPEINDAVEIRRKDGSKLVAETAQQMYRNGSDRRTCKRNGGHCHRRTNYRTCGGGYFRTYL